VKLAIVRVSGHHFAIRNERTGDLLTSYDPFTEQDETVLCGCISEAARYIADEVATRYPSDDLITAGTSVKDLY
jgi:hypothetical protein